MLLISENSLPNPRSQMFSPVSSTSSIGLHFTFRTMIHFVVNFVYDTEYVRSLFAFYLANICWIVSITHALIQSTWVCNLGLTYSHLHTAWAQELAFAPHSHTRGDCFSRSALGLGSDLYSVSSLPTLEKKLHHLPGPEFHHLNMVVTILTSLGCCEAVEVWLGSRILDTHTHTHTHTHKLRKFIRQEDGSEWHFGVEGQGWLEWTGVFLNPFLCI